MSSAASVPLCGMSGDEIPCGLGNENARSGSLSLTIALCASDEPETKAPATFRCFEAAMHDETIV